MEVFRSGKSDSQIRQKFDRAKFTMRGLVLDHWSSGQPDVVVVARDSPVSSGSESARSNAFVIGNNRRRLEIGVELGPEAKLSKLLHKLHG